VNSGDAFRLVFETAPEPQLLLDSAGVVVSVSQGYLGATGSERRAVLGQPVTSLPPYRDAPAASALLRGALATVLRTAIPVSSNLPDAGRPGGVTFSSASSLPVIGEGGAVTHVAHRLERTMTTPDGDTERERRFMKLVEKNYDAILLGDARAHIFFASPAIERITGYTPEEFLARPPGGDLHPDDAPRVGEDVRAVLTQPGCVRLTRSRRRHKAGHYTTIEITMANLLNDPDVGAVVVNLRDITEQVALEENLRESQKLESLGVLAGGIAHDFNNLLSTILGNTSLMADEFEGRPRAIASVAQVETAARRAADLCKQMLAYAGRTTLSRSHTNLDVLIEETTQLLRVSISKKVDLKFSVQPELPRISADPTQVQQVLVNLILNASEAVGQGPGLVEVRANVKHVDHAFLRQTMHAADVAEGRYVSLEVRDSGPGIAAGARARIFEPFFSTKGAGRGLGLAAVLGIVRAHGGALRLSSEPGNGSSFEILFPAAAPEVEHAAAPESTRTPLGPQGSILLVEDEPALRAVQVRMLARFGMRVIEASNGRDAVEIYRQRGSEIAGVLMDLTMPHMNGEEAFRELVDMDPAVRVILMSGYTKSDDVARLVAEGRVGFMAKPFALRELERQLGELLQPRNAV
jgi:two-component system cell cycle sensor histidine kinase/response regulator CckA